jgi:hypothetical protein
MGKLSRGFLGGFQGQLGTAYGCFWRLMDLIKAMPRKVKRAPTEAQVPVRLRMALMTSFLSRIASIIKIGFKDVAPAGQSAMNAAVSYNITNAITGASPDFMIDFTKLVLSKGKLAQPFMPEILIDTAGQIKFSWQQNVPGSDDGKPTDKANFVVFNPTKNKFVVLSGAVTRSALTYSLAVPADFSADEVHCYMNFVSADGKQVSESYYVGEFLLL